MKDSFGTHSNAFLLYNVRCLKKNLCTSLWHYIKIASLSATWSLGNVTKDRDR